MTYQVLARKWRPREFSQVIGQDSIVQSLVNALKRGQVGHAYLFAGTRGVGKTSVARIFAKAICCENLDKRGNTCGECPPCRSFTTEFSMNVWEIDGASHNSVDDVRDLVANVQYLPTSGKYKVYIIDEVHMLSASAFNALLKTLEGPPAHVVFILATTMPEKLLKTVLSRCQRFDFRTLNTLELKEMIKKLSAQEGIEFKSEQLIEKIGQMASGSIRDALSLLDQVLSFCPDRFISEEILVKSLGIARSSAIGDIVESILEGNAGNCSKSYRQLLIENIPMQNIATEILSELYNRIQADQTGNIGNISQAEFYWIYETLAKDAQWALDSPWSDKVLEIILQKICLRHTFFGRKQSAVREETPLAASPSSPSAPASSSTSSTPSVPTASTASTIPTWEGFLNYVKVHSPMLAVNLEQGNIMGAEKYTQKGLEINVGLSKSRGLFFEYLQDKETFNKVVNYLARYFKKDANQVHLKFTLIDDRQQKASNFLSRGELLRREEEQRQKKERENFQNDPLLKGAEVLFDAKIDKIVLGEGGRGERSTPST